MYNVNFLAGWYQAAPKKIELAEHKDPTRCDLCVKPIEEGDHYNAGYDSHKMYIETCDHYDCTKWLKHSIRLRKGY